MTMMYNPDVPLKSDLIANGGCYRCGKPDHLLDTGLHIHMEGALTFCQPCIIEMAHTSGMELQDQGVRDQLEQAVRTQERTQAELDRKNTLLAELGASAAAEAERARQAEEAQFEVERARIANGQHPVTGKFLSKAEKAALLEIDQHIQSGA